MEYRNPTPACSPYSGADRRTSRRAELIGDLQSSVAAQGHDFPDPEKRWQPRTTLLRTEAFIKSARVPLSWVFPYASSQNALSIIRSEMRGIVSKVDGFARWAY